MLRSPKPIRGHENLFRGGYLPRLWLYNPMIIKVLNAIVPAVPAVIDNHSHSQLG
jgi:hypothetical protein